MEQARYDGVADWYDTEVQPAPLEGERWETLVRLLGEPVGTLIDVGCGPGGYAYDEAPGRSGNGLRARIGVSFHRPLALFLQTFLDAGFRLERIEEPEERDYPHVLALRWRR